MRASHMGCASAWKVPLDRFRYCVDSYLTNFEKQNAGEQGPPAKVGNKVDSTD